MINSMYAYLKVGLDGFTQHLRVGAGFTLVETLVAVLMLSLSIAGPLTIASKGIAATTIAKDQFVAFYLAQDAMEYVRFLRDTSCLGDLSGGSDGCAKDVWLSSLSNCKSVDGSSACFFDSMRYNPSTVDPCPLNVCGPLYYNSTTKKFDYNSSPPAVIPAQRFVRTVQIQHAINGPTLNDDADEAIVTITVSWRSISGATRNVVVRESLFRWQ